MYQVYFLVERKRSYYLKVGAQFRILERARIFAERLGKNNPDNYPQIIITCLVFPPEKLSYKQGQDCFLEAFFKGVAV